MVNSFPYSIYNNSNPSIDLNQLDENFDPVEAFEKEVNLSESPISSLFNELIQSFKSRSLGDSSDQVKEFKAYKLFQDENDKPILDKNGRPILQQIDIQAVRGFEAAVHNRNIALIDRFNNVHTSPEFKEKISNFESITVEDLDGKETIVESLNLNIHIFTQTEMKLLSNFALLQYAIYTAKKQIEDQKKLAEEKKHKESNNLQQTLIKHLNGNINKNETKKELKNEPFFKINLNSTNKNKEKQLENQIILKQWCLESLLDEREKTKEAKKLAEKKEEIFSTLTTSNLKEEIQTNLHNEPVKVTRNVEKSFGLNIKNKFIKQIK